jgi:hypothetical protein
MRVESKHVKINYMVFQIVKRRHVKVQVNLKFTTKGQVALNNFDNGEIIELFTRYSNTLKKKYMLELSVPNDVNQNINEQGAVVLLLDHVECDIDIFFRELGRDIKVPLKKRFEGKLDTIFKTEIIGS